MSTARILELGGGRYGTPTDSGTSYLSVDQLGSTRLLQQSIGTARYYDYFPFGEDIPASQYGRGTGYASGVYPASGPDFLSFKFTGKERDWESGLDFSQARYYSPWQGRFGGVDPENAGADSGSPQTFHGYAYVTNRPLVYTDPSGLEQDGPGRWFWRNMEYSQEEKPGAATGDRFAALVASGRKARCPRGWGGRAKDARGSRIGSEEHPPTCECLC